MILFAVSNHCRVMSDNFNGGHECLFYSAEFNGWVCFYVTDNVMIYDIAVIKDTCCCRYRCIN